MRILIKNGNTILPDKILKNSAVLIENGRIKDILKDPDYEIETDETIDAQGNYISPGFIDTHVHGGM